ncbi:MAG: amidohydrolase family protein [Bacteroidota bacterium]
MRTSSLFSFWNLGGFGSFLLCTFCVISLFQPPEETYDLAIKGVTIFDPILKTRTPDQTVLIRGDQIAAIIPAKNKVKAKQTVAGKGRLLCPGFIDTHIHFNQIYDKGRNYFPDSAEWVQKSAKYQLRLKDQYLQYGTTTIADMGMIEPWIDQSLRWQREAGSLIPDLYLTGGALISEHYWDRRPPEHHIVVKDSLAARAKVQSYYDKGIRHIKLYWKLEEPEMRAAVAQAEALGMEVFAHIDNGIMQIDDVMAMGVRHFEHFFTLIPSSLPMREEMQPLDTFYGLGPINNIDQFAANMVAFFGYIKAHPEHDASLKALIDRMVEQEGSISTALHVLAAGVEQSTFFSSFDWYPPREVPDLGYTPEQMQDLKEALGAMMYYMQYAHQQGLTLRIGTDCRNGGRALLAELKLLVEGGFDLADVLQIATWNGAKALGIEEEVGSITVGKKANLLLFHKDPFEDHAHLAGKKTVIKAGAVVAP